MGNQDLKTLIASLGYTPLSETKEGKLSGGFVCLKKKKKKKKDKKKSSWDANNCMCNGNNCSCNKPSYKETDPKGKANNCQCNLPVNQTTAPKSPSVDLLGLW